MKLTPINPHFNACDQKWELMPEQDGGRLCDACERVLIDFTPFTEQEVVNQQRANDFKICGRYTRGQVDRLHRHLTLEETQSNRPWLVSLAMGLGSLLPMGAEAQNILIPVGDITLATDSSAYQPIDVVLGNMKPLSLENEEVVLDTVNVITALTVPMPGLPGDIQYPLLDNSKEAIDSIELFGRVKEAGTGEPIVFANIVIKGTHTGTTSDFDGYFSFKVPLSYGKVTLEVSCLGYESDSTIVDMNSIKTKELSIEMPSLPMTTHFIGIVVHEPTLGQKIKSWSNPVNWYRRIKHRIRYK